MGSTVLWGGVAAHPWRGPKGLCRQLSLHPPPRRGIRCPIHGGPALAAAGSVLASRARWTVRGFCLCHTRLRAAAAGAAGGYPGGENPRCPPWTQPGWPGEITHRALPCRGRPPGPDPGHPCPDARWQCLAQYGRPVHHHPPLHPLSQATPVNLTEILDQWASTAPERPAIIERQGSTSFAQLQALSCGVAQGLRAAGLGAGERVVILAPMSAALYAGLLGAWRMGATVVAVDPGAGSAQLARIIARTAPRALLASAGALWLRWRYPPLRRIPLALRLGGGFSLRRRMDRPGPILAPCQVAESHPALLTATSGSTGEPKIALRSHGLLRAQHKAIAAALGSQAGDISLATLAIFALSDLASGQTVLIADANLRRPGAIDPRPVLRQIAQYRPQVVVASPAFLQRLLPGDLSPLSRIFTGGAPVFPQLLDRLAQAAPAARIAALYGSTEAEPIAHLDHGDLDQSTRQAIAGGSGLAAGKAVAEVDCRILRADGSDCDPQEAGEICVAGDHVIPGYLDGLGDGESKLRRDGRIYHRSGDCGRLDAKGQLWLLGRMNAVVHDGRGLLYPFAVEAAAMGIAGVRRCALLARGGSRLLAVEAEGNANPLPALEQALAWAQVDQMIPCVIPVDRRHNAKVDYPALRRQLEV
ncbi:MAG: AMP-dependent synthetase [Planctomycetota bacterium]|nr:MAG: AMP-dependent synthetase [Planctomycetota bacterium]